LEGPGNNCITFKVKTKDLGIKLRLTQTTRKYFGEGKPWEPWELEVICPSPSFFLPKFGIGGSWKLKSLKEVIRRLKS